jgi:flagellar basal body-associated protein FliL
VENPLEDRALAEHLAELLVALPYVESVSEREKEMFEYRFATIARQHDPSININLRGCVFAASTVAAAEDCFRQVYTLGSELVHPVSPDATGAVETYELGDFILNLSGSGGARILMMELVVEASPETIARVDARLPMIRHEVLMGAMEYTVRDLEDGKGKRALQASIERWINEAIAPSQVYGVYFVELRFGN